MNMFKRVFVSTLLILNNGVLFCAWSCSHGLCSRQLSGKVFEFRPAPPSIHHMPHAGVLAAASSHAKAVTQAAGNGYPQVVAIAEKASAQKVEDKKAVVQKKAKDKIALSPQMHHNQVFYGLGGAKCYWDDIQKANTVANALADDRYKANPILAMLIVLLGNYNIAGFQKVDASCSWDNIKDLYCEVEKHLKHMIELDKASQVKKFGVGTEFMKYSFSLNAFAGILRYRGQRALAGEAQTGLWFFEKNTRNFLSKNGYPSCRPVMPEEADYHQVNGYNLVTTDEKGFTYKWVSMAEQPKKEAPLGHIKLDDMFIRFDWFKKW